MQLHMSKLWCNKVYNVYTSSCNWNLKRTTYTTVYYMLWFCLCTQQNEVTVGHDEVFCSCLPLLLLRIVDPFQPLPNLIQIVKEGSLPSKVDNFSLLYYTNSFIGYTKRNVGIIVHAVSHQLALWWQRKVLDECACCSKPLLQILMLLDIKRIGAHRRGHPAIRGVGLINVHKQKISYITEVLYQPPERRQLADERGSGGWAKINHQRAI